ncbi:MAG: hypothetical protein ACFNNL_01275 [Kingella oralis]
MAGWDDVFRLPLCDNRGSLKTIMARRQLAVAAPRLTVLTHISGCLIAKPQRQPETQSAIPNPNPHKSPFLPTFPVKHQIIANYCSYPRG